jgi:PTS system nitrogen regulatory IIA component
MRMSDFVVREAIVPALAAQTKEGVIREMVDSLHSAGFFRHAGELDEVVRAIMYRESLGSTGIGRGIAIPHTKHGNVDRLIGTVALAPNGISAKEYTSIDEKDVFVFVLLVSPADRPGDHLRALEGVVYTMREDKFVEALRKAATRDEIWALLDQAPPRGER